MQSLQKKSIDAVAQLGTAQENARLKLAARAASVVSFDWTIPDNDISWDGSLEILPYHMDGERLTKGATFLNFLSVEGRDAVSEIINNQSMQETPFELDLELSSAMGSIWYTMTGTRFAGPSGRTERLTGILRVTTERQLELRRLSYLATRDELTGHLNRNALRTELAQAITRAKSENRSCAFLVASVDRLAMINDGYGFDAGEEVIVAVGERMARSLRASDVIGRTAGNKFGVVLTNCSEREIPIVAERLRAAVRSNVIDTRAGQISATSSVGAVLLPSGAATSQEAMLRAEEALDRARSAGRDGFHVYEKSPQREMARLRLMGIADEVISALKSDRLMLAYQPIICAGTRKVSHYEGLLRMRRPDGGIDAAGAFVPAAEQLGIVRLIDRRALEMTIAKLHEQPNIRLSVNVSGTAANDPAWLKSFIEHVRAHRPVADRLVVELTETAALHHFEQNAQFISQLRDLGCQLAIDDFGAGYTSFRNLQMLRVDMVKIDGSYVKGLASSPENQIFVRTLVELAKSFDLDTVAEWVSSEEEAEILQKMGVDYLQGFHFGEPKLEPDWV